MMMGGNDYVDGFAMITHERIMQTLLEYRKSLKDLFIQKIEENGIISTEPNLEGYFALLKHVYYVKYISQVIIRWPAEVKPIFMHRDLQKKKLYKQNEDAERLYHEKWPDLLKSKSVQDFTLDEVVELYNSKNKAVKRRFPSIDIIQQRWKRLWWCCDYFLRSPYVDFEDILPIKQYGWKLVKFKEFPGRRFCLRSDEVESQVLEALLESKKRKFPNKTTEKKRIKSNA